METLKTILPAVIALVGTLIVAFIGYRQWKGQQRSTGSAPLLAEKRQAYTAVWQKLEVAHLFIRSETFDRQRYLELVREVNMEMMQSGLLLEPGEKGVVNSYLVSMETLAKSLDDYEDSAIRDDARERMYITADLPPEILERASGLRDAYLDLERKRDEVQNRFRRVIGADII